MNIQWFPGHMTKALRMMDENVKIIDAIGYVLDARAPLSCFNPSFDKIIGDKPCVFILNKCDLADSEKVKLWCDWFSKNDMAYVKVTATASAEAGKIVSAFYLATEQLRQKIQKKGVFRPVRFLIIGVPNCGKSTLINCLSGRKAVVTGDKPGVTKGKQWVRLQNGIELLDTPGTLWPKFDNDIVARRLCFIGSIKDDIVDLHEVALALIDELSEQYPQLLKDRYSITDLSDNQKVFENIGKKRGLLIRGGEIDEERCSKAILDDFRKGKIGRITLDVPQK